MNTIGVLLLTAASATGQLGGPFAGHMHWLRPHVVATGAAPGAAGCLYGHPGCAGGAGCPGPGGGPGGGPGAVPGQAGRRFPNTRSQLRFVGPEGLRIGWQTAAGGGERVYLPAQLTAPASYNFPQGYIYRLKLTDIPNRPNLVLYPTIEVAPSTPATDAYLTHNQIPVQFTEEDFDQVQAGNFVTKVVYLPDPRYQELAIAGVETLVSTRLEPGVDPILEADRRGTILMIIRMGGINLELRGLEGSAVGPTYAPAPGAPTYVPQPGSLPPGVVPGAPVMTPAGPVDTAPVSPAPPSPGPFNPPAVAPAPAPPPATAPPPPDATVPPATAPGAPAPGTY